MKSKPTASRVIDRFGMIEPLESRIAPAAASPVYLPANPSFVTVTAGSSLLVKAGQVLTTGIASGGTYLLYVAQGQVLVHTTDLNHNGVFDFNELTGLSVGAGAVVVSFVDIHGDVVTDLNPDGTLSDGGKGDILLDSNIVEIDMRSLTTNDFPSSSDANLAVSTHLAFSNYSIFGNIYAGGGLGLPNDPASGLAIDTSGATLQLNKFTGNGNNYVQVEPVIGSIYAGSSASGKYFNFGINGPGATDFGNLLTFTPGYGEAGASIYNIGTASGEPFSIGTVHAGDGGFNAPGGNVINAAFGGDNAGTYKVIAGNAGPGTTGQVGGSILNFSESGTVLGQVVLQSGNGGTGLVGAGGNAGQIEFNTNSPVQANAQFILQYGSGGNGYTQGGAGGGTPSGTFVTPAGVTTTALDLVTKMHTIGSIGATTSFDFNGDGISDAVFSTTNPDQVVVAMGTVSSGGAYGFDSGDYIYLNSPLHVTSIAVGDFTGAVNPITQLPEADIAVAGGANGYAGIEVYLSQYNPQTGAFEGFSDPLFTPIPSIFGTYTTTPITQLLAGDFTGDGVMGLAALVQTGGGVGAGHSVLLFLNGETTGAQPDGTGFFYVNLANKNIPIHDFGPSANFNPTNSIFEVTALKTFKAGSGHDVILESNLGAQSFNVISDYSGLGKPAVAVLGGSFGKVDTNRVIGMTSATNFYDLSFAVTQDPSNHNIADVAVLSESPAGFLEIFQGNGTGNFTLQTGDGGDNSGIDFGNPTSSPVAIATIPNQAGTAYSDVAILDYSSLGTDLIYAINISVGNGGLLTGAKSGSEFWSTIVPTTRVNTTALIGVYEAYPSATVGVPLGAEKFSFVVADPLTSYPDKQAFAISGTTPESTFTTLSSPFKVDGYFFIGGDGGSSQSGPGGAGGSFGSTLTVSGSGSSISATGSLSVEFPTNESYQGGIYFLAGSGGNGFNAGGAGGNVIGVSVTYPSSVTLLTGIVDLYAGTGGESLTGSGGPGGTLAQMYVQTGQVFVAGNGGIGVYGGSGGGVLGNTQAGLNTATSNSQDPYIQVYGGVGATGILGGGGGGPIVSFMAEYLAIEGGNGGELYYVGGSAGDAVAGQAGTGGSILNSSPNSQNNNLDGPIWLQGGYGGSGLYGGGGGSVINFVQSSTNGEIPTSFTLLGGFGGNATLGTGGGGGYVTGIQVDGAGAPGPDNDGFPFVQVNYNRIVAGAGGSSLGGTGGAGGYVSDIGTATIAPNSQNVVVAGAGGSGLSAGGAGGSLTSIQADAGASSSVGKVIAIAGDGGASYSVKPEASTTTGRTATEIADQTAVNVANAIGGVNGPGGNGGSIITFTQSGDVNAHVDLIAGNGGMTINHSVVAAEAYAAANNSVSNLTADNSGVGGSVENISVEGTIGNTDSTTPIKSYNDIFTGQTMQDFVDTTILGGVGGTYTTSLTGSLTDSVGNVGLVAGAGGRVEGGLPSSNGISGTVTNIRAAGIMSMVAGNVDEVDLIQSLTNYAVTTTEGALGSNKTEFYNPVTKQTVDEVNDPSSSTGMMMLELGDLNYLTPTGAYATTPLPGGGILIDGAFVAKNIRTIQSARDFQGTVS